MTKWRFNYDSGEYQKEDHKFVGEAKAEQSLVIKGKWGSESVLTS